MGRSKSHKKSKSKRRRRYGKLCKVLDHLARRLGSSSSEENTSDSGSEYVSDSAPINWPCPGSDSEALEVAAECSPVVDPAADLITALGANPADSAQTAIELHQEVVVRWTTYLQQGLSKDMRTELLSKYPPPSNCVALTPPLLNEELQACLPDFIVKQDKFFTNCQLQLAAGLSALAHPINNFLKSGEGEGTHQSKELLSPMAESAQIFANIFHTISCHRRYIILPHIKPDYRKLMEANAIDVCLFGSGLQEKVRVSQAVQKTGSEMRSKPSSAANSQPGPSQSHSRTLNSRRLPPRTRMKVDSKKKYSGREKWFSDRNKTYRQGHQMKNLH